MKEPSMAQVKIKIKGSIDPEWSDWLAGMQVTALENRETLLTGELVDQAALFGVLSRLYSLGLVLLSMQTEDMYVQKED
jgi:hypothetical protein